MDVAAALSLNVDSSKVVQATNDLDRFSASSDRAAAASAKVNFGNQSGSIAKLVASVQSIDNKLSALIGTLSRAQQAEKALSAANDNMASSVAKAGAAVSAADAHVIAYTQHLAQLARAQRDANAHVLAYRAQMAATAPVMQQADAHVLAYRKHIEALPKSLGDVSTAIKFTARDGLNASRQLADIGVTAAMGMSPLMIALQQGPQLFDILQERAIATGSTIGATFRAAGAAIWAALAPLLPIILPIAAAIGLVVAGLAALTKQANDDSGLKKYTTAMGYTKKEVEKLNAVTVTMGDTAKAVFQVGWQRIADAFDISTDGIKKAWQSVMDFLITAARATVAAVYAALTGLGYAVKRTLDNIRAGKVENPLTTLVEAGKAAYGDAQKFMDDVVKQAQANARARQDKLAKALYDARKTPKGPKSDAEKLADIVGNAEAEIRAEQSRAAAVGMSARAAAELEQKTKLLNQIEKAKIPVTKAVSAEVERLSKAYADAKIAAESAAAVQGVIDGLQKQGAAINDQLALVGAYGDELTRARIEMEALTAARNALPPGETLSAEDSGRILAGAQSVADDQINLDRAARAEKVRKDAEDAMYALDLERKGLGLTGAAAESYAYVMERLNDAKRQGIELSPAEIAAIKAAGDAYGAARYAIDQQRQAIADAREVAKGFFSDWINGVREGGSVFKTFADSVVNSLNRIIDKLLDRGLDSFLNGMFSGGGGGGGLFSSLFKSIGMGGGSSRPIFGGGTQGNLPGGALSYAALGNVYGSAMRFANGGAFTNSIVTSPTLFRFANGAKLGEMGEAGPEAIMPLKRGPNGALGVQVHGGQSGGRKPDININNNYSFAGAIGLDGIASMVRQGGEATYNQVKRDLQSLLQQLDADGAFAS